MGFSRSKVAMRQGYLWMLLTIGLWASGCGETAPNFVHTNSPVNTQPQLSGEVTYLRLHPQSEVERDSGRRLPAVLDFSSPERRPVRYARIELLDEDGVRLESGNTDGEGQYRLEIPTGVGPVRVRVYSESVEVAGESAPISVRDNTEGGAVYAVESDPVERQSLEVDIEIPTGYDEEGEQTGASRPSAPFACLDGVLTGYRYMLAGGVDSSTLPLCVVNWSQRNRPESGEVSQGQIQTSNFSFSLNELFILGFREADTDEFDWHIMIHELGHWIQANRFRYDRVGGSHAAGESKDPRLAFAEGFGNAFGGLALDDPIYKDTATPSGFSYSLECNGTFPGWFSETSIEAILYDLFDPVRSEGGDSAFDDRLSFGATKFVAARDFQKSSSALTTIFSFLHGLVGTELAENELVGLTSLLQRESPTPTHGINSLNEFAVGETHDGGLYPLPVYTDLSGVIGAAPLPVTVGGQSSSDALNWLSGVRFFTFVGDGDPLTITLKNSTSAVGHLAMSLYESGQEVDDDDDDDDEDDEYDPFEDFVLTRATRSGSIYVLVVVNLATESSTADLLLTR